MIEAARVYEQRREGLGFRFIRVVEETAERIAATPDAGSPVEGGYRKRLWTPPVMGSGSVQRGLSAIRPWSDRPTRVMSTRPDDGKTL